MSSRLAHGALRLAEEILVDEGPRAGGLRVHHRHGPGHPRVVHNPPRTAPHPPAFGRGAAAPQRLRNGRLSLQAVLRRDLGVMTMKQGEVAVITASPENAYGADGFPSWGILPNSTLRFEIEVLQC